MEWYSVKLLYKITVSGEPDKSKLDEHYCETRLYFEESALLVKADSFDHAYVLAVNHAKSNYDTYENIYGQKVTWEFDRTLDCFRMTEAPGSFVEAYSSIFAVKNGGNADKLIQKRYETCTAETMRPIRRK